MFFSILQILVIVGFCYITFKSDFKITPQNLNEYNLLTQRLFRLVFQQQPKEKLLKVRCDTGDIIEVIIVTKESEKSE